MQFTGSWVHIFLSPVGTDAQYHRGVLRRVDRGESEQGRKRVMTAHAAGDRMQVLLVA